MMKIIVRVGLVLLGVVISLIGCAVVKQCSTEGLEVTNQIVIRDGYATNESPVATLHPGLRIFRDKITGETWIPLTLLSGQNLTNTEKRDVFYGDFTAERKQPEADNTVDPYR